MRDPWHSSSQLLLELQNPIEPYAQKYRAARVVRALPQISGKDPLEPGTSRSLSSLVNWSTRLS